MFLSTFVTLFTQQPVDKKEEREREGGGDCINPQEIIFMRSSNIGIIISAYVTLVQLQWLRNERINTFLSTWSANQ